MCGCKAPVLSMNGSLTLTPPPGLERNWPTLIHWRILHEWVLIRILLQHVDLVKQATLLILSSSAFGRHNSWNEDSTTHYDISSETKISYAAAVLAAIDNSVPQVLIPRWLFKLAKQIHIPYLGPFVNETQESFDTLRHHIHELINVRAWATGDKGVATDAALIRNLVEANLAQEDDALQKRLTDEELISNTFVSIQSFVRSSRLVLNALSCSWLPDMVCCNFIVYRVAIN